MSGAGAKRHPFEIFFACLKLGLTSFGGPVAHLGYFRSEFVERPDFNTRSIVACREEMGGTGQRTDTAQ